MLICRILLKTCRRGRYKAIQAVAAVAAKLRRHKPEVCIRLIDAVLEELQWAMEHPSLKDQQRTITVARLLGELYCASLASGQLVIQQLYKFINFGHEIPEALREASEKHSVLAGSSSTPSGTGISGVITEDEEMDDNPFSPPSALERRTESVSSTRSSARRSIQLSLLIFLIPTIYNFVCFDIERTRSIAEINNIVTPMVSFFQIIGFIGIANAFIALCFLTLPLCEIATLCLNRWLGQRNNLDLWKTELYASMIALPKFAIPGAILWSLWVFLFYQFGMAFTTVSISVSVAAHLLAATFYIPLFVAWFKIERSSHSQ